MSGKMITLVSAVLAIITVLILGPSLAWVGLIVFIGIPALDFARFSVCEALATRRK